MSESDNFSFSERNKRAKTTVNAPPPEAQSGGPAPEYSAPPPRDQTPPPRDYHTPPPPRDYTPPPPREYLPPPPEAAPRSRSDDDEEGSEFELPIDPRRLLGALRRRWLWMVYTGAGCLLMGAVAGYFLSTYKIAVTLIQRDVGAPFEAGVGGEVFKPHMVSANTLINLMESAQIRQKVSAEAKPYISPRALGKALTIRPERNTELVTIILAGKDQEDLVNLANLYADKAVALTKEVQLEDLSRILKAYQEKEHTAGDDIAKVDKEMQAFTAQYKSFNPETETMAYTKRMADVMDKIAANDTQIELYDQQLTNTLGLLAMKSQETKKLEAMKEELRVLRTKYTDQYPVVQNKIQEIAEQEKQLANPTTVFGTNKAPSALNVDLQAKRDTLIKENVGLTNQFQELRNKALSVSDVSGRYSYIKARQDSLQNNIKMLRARRIETEYYHDNADGYYRVLSKASLNDIETRSRWMKLLMVAVAGMVFGILGAAAVIIAAEVADDRLKTAADVKRVTGLPLLASLGDLNKMTPSEKEHWAFRAWTALSGQLSRSANHGMVCGFISSTHGEGRTTWINLLVDAASQRGLRVLTISTRPSPTDLEEMDRAAAEAEKQFAEAVEEAMTPSSDQMPSTAVTITAQALAFPAQIAQKFSGPEALPSAHIALPGWVWNLERRRQFQRALAHWRSIDNMVLLVELPPASVPEAVLLAENLPQLIWLVDNGKPRARETREQLETLRHAKCRLVGAVLNHESESVWKI